jgi:hypothetical protein
MRLPRFSFMLALGMSALFAQVGCAYNATGSDPPKQLIFEFALEGDTLLPSPNWAYYLVIDTNGKPEDGPLVNGPAPLQYPYPDPRSYLPWVRDESAVLDREPVSIPNTYWSTFFALYEENGQFVVWQGRPNPDGTINERVRQLQKGREWGLKDGKTLQLQLPFTLIRDVGSTDDAVDPPQWEANLCVANRGSGRLSRDFVIDRWGQVINTYFAIQTRSINQNLYDPFPGVTFPQNLPPAAFGPNMNITTITYRVVVEK